MARFLFLFVVLIPIIFIGLVSYLNREDPSLSSAVEIITSNEVIETNLNRYKDVIGDDYLGYRNHLYRVLTYSQHFLHGDTTYLSEIAMALVYHDIGLWTDSTLAYLEPSSFRAETEGKEGFSDAQMELIKSLVYWHHKITPFRGAHADIVNAVRKADWIDASMGLITQRMPKSVIQKVSEGIPAAGFYDTLANFGPRLHGNNVPKILSQIITIYKW